MTESALAAVDEALQLGLADLAPVTRQVIFDLVVLHYRAQPRRCPKEGQCFYRRQGDGCFVHPLIDDEHYDPDMEGYKVRDLIKRFAMPAWFRENIGLIEELQAIHDTETNWVGDRMEKILEMFSTDRGLTMPNETVGR